MPAHRSPEDEIRCRRRGGRAAQSCVQLDRCQKSLAAAVLERDAEGRRVRKAGIMGVVLRSGGVSAGDRIMVERPASPHRALEPV
jgi:MOSC domain-containing protein YiiM